MAAEAVQIDLEDTIEADEMTALIVPVSTDPLCFFTSPKQQQGVIAKVTELVDAFTPDTSTRAGRDALRRKTDPP